MNDFEMDAVEINLVSEVVKPRSEDELTLSEKVSKLRTLKVVLLHDWLTGHRGGERVLEIFCEIFPTAPLYTLFHVPASTSEKIENRKIVASFLNRFPQVKRYYRKLLPLYPLGASSIDIQEEGVDLILSSSHCVIKGVKKKSAKTKHVAYLHTPMRYIYDQFSAYFGSEAPFLYRCLGKICRPYLLRWDQNSNDDVDVFLANSYFVQQRIADYYHRPAEVIWPFVDMQDFYSVHLSPPLKEDYYVIVTAFAPNKRIDLAIQAFKELNLPLKIIGSGQQEAYLKKLASGSKIEFLGSVGREEIVKALARAQALIFPGIEDFGIVPLESLSAGTPVIAYRKGGVLETLNDEVAIFFDEQNVESLKGAVKRHQESYWDRKVLWERATEFGKDVFWKKMIDELYAVAFENKHEIQ